MDHCHISVFIGDFRDAALLAGLDTPGHRLACQVGRPGHCHVGAAGWQQILALCSQSVVDMRRLLYFTLCAQCRFSSDDNEDALNDIMRLKLSLSVSAIAMCHAWRPGGSLLRSLDLSHLPFVLILF